MVTTPDRLDLSGDGRNSANEAPSDVSPLRLRSLKYLQYFQMVARDGSD